MKVLITDLRPGAGRDRRRVASLDRRDVWHPSCGSKSWIVQDRWIEVDQSFANAVMDLVEVSES